jgi:hypothetical protein
MNMPFLSPYQRRTQEARIQIKDKIGSTRHRKMKRTSTLIVPCWGSTRKASLSVFRVIGKKEEVDEKGHILMVEGQGRNTHPSYRDV